MSSRVLPELRSIVVGGRRLAWRESGAGIAVVLVHGIGGYSGAWTEQFAALSSDHRVIAWDAPGYGGSDALASEGTVDVYAEALVGLLVALEIDRPHLVGHSLGSIIASEASHADFLSARSITLLQPVTGGGRLPADERSRVRLARIADMKRLGAVQFAAERGRNILSKSTPVTLVDEAVEVMKAVPEEGYLAAWNMMCTADIFAALNTQCPTQVICGSDDPVSPPETGREVARRIPGADFISLNGVGHYASIEAPEMLGGHLRRFITSHE